MTGFARQKIRETARYIQSEFSKRYRDDFLYKVQETRQYLATNPNLGSMEPLLSNRPTAYRSVVITKLNKMVHYINDTEDIIYIVDFWDTRREPNAQAAEVKWTGYNIEM